MEMLGKNMRGKIFFIILVGFFSISISKVAFARDDNFDVRGIKVYRADTADLYTEDSSAESGKIELAKGISKRMRYRLEITVRAREDIEDGEFFIELRKASGEALFPDGDSTSYSAKHGWWREVPTLDDNETYTYVEYLDVLPDAREGDTFTIELDDQKINLREEGRETDEDDEIDFKVVGEMDPVDVEQNLPAAPVLQPLPDTIDRDHVQVFAGRSARADAYRVYQSKDSGEYTYIMDARPGDSFKPRNLKADACYSWYVVPYNSNGDGPMSNVVSTCRQNHDESLAPGLACDIATFVGGEKATLTITGLTGAFYYSLQKYRDYSLYDTASLDASSLVEQLSGNYERYSFRVRAHYSNGQDSAWSNEVVLTNPAYTGNGGTNDDQPVQQENSPPEIVSETILETNSCGAAFGATLSFHDPDGDDLTVQWLLNGMLQKTYKLDNRHYTSEYNTRSINLGDHVLKAVVRDEKGGITEFEHTFTLTNPIRNEKNYFQARYDEEVYYYMGNVLTRGSFEAALEREFNDSQHYLIEPLPGTDGWFTVQGTDEEEVLSLRGVGEVIFGVFGACNSQTGEICDLAEAEAGIIVPLFSGACTVFGVPVVDTVVDGTSFVVNLVMAKVNQAQYYMFQGSREDYNDMVTHMAKKDMALTALTVPIIAGTTHKAIYKFTSVVPEPMKTIMKNMDTFTPKFQDDVYKILLKERYAKNVIDEAITMAKDAKLTTQTGVGSIDTVEFFAEVAQRNSLTKPQKEILIDTIARFDEVNIDSNEMAEAFVKAQAEYQFTVAMADIAAKMAQALAQAYNGESVDPDLTAEYRAEFYLEARGAETVEGLDGQRVFRKKSDHTQFMLLPKVGGGSPGSGWKAYVDLDMVRRAPYNDKEIWITQVVGGLLESYDNVLEMELAKIDSTLVGYLKATGYIDTSATVRKVAFVDESIVDYGTVSLFDRMLCALRTAAAHAQGSLPNVIVFPRSSNNIVSGGGSSGGGGGGGCVVGNGGAAVYAVLLAVAVLVLVTRRGKHRG